MLSVLFLRFSLFFPGEISLAQAGWRGLRSAAEQPRSRSTMNSSRRKQRGWPSGFAKASPDNQAKPRYPFGGLSSPLRLSKSFEWSDSRHDRCSGKKIRAHSGRGLHYYRPPEAFARANGTHGWLGWATISSNGCGMPCSCLPAGFRQAGARHGTVGPATCCRRNVETQNAFEFLP